MPIYFGKILTLPYFSVTISGLNVDAATPSKHSPNSNYYLWAKSRIGSCFVRLGGRACDFCEVRRVGGRPGHSFTIAVCRRVPYIARDSITASAAFVFLLRDHQPTARSDFEILQLRAVQSISPCHAAPCPGSYFCQALDKSPLLCPEKYAGGLKPALPLSHSCEI